MDVWDADLKGVVRLPDGRSVRGRALRGPRPKGEEVPDFGVYLTSFPLIAPGWEAMRVRWPDFLLPTSHEEAVQALREAHERATTMKVEICCGGGVGRTGTAIAILARLAGVPREGAVEWVRQNYSARAVETPWQRRFVERVELTL